MTSNLVAVGDKASTNLLRVTTDLTEIDKGGIWVVLAYFNTPIIAIEIEDWQPLSQTQPDKWSGAISWESLMTRDAYMKLVDEAKMWISRGDLYQVNVCRLLRAPLPQDNDLFAVYCKLQLTPYGQNILYIRLNSELAAQVGKASVEVLSLSPESFLIQTDNQISSRPIKGTAKTGEAFLTKDTAENIMIVDLMRNDLSQVCLPHSVSVPELLQREELPYASQLVSEVRGILAPDVSWSDILTATFPPGSVTGAPKSSALRFIQEFEHDRDIYCGTVGIIDSNSSTADLKVAIRTFWKNDGYLYYGAGAGITWGSDASLEWEETELKSQTLINLLGDSA
jgi:para-aminobenzoate synthetase component 1